MIYWLSGVGIALLIGGAWAVGQLLSIGKTLQKASDATTTIKKAQDNATQSQDSAQGWADRPKSDDDFEQRLRDQASHAAKQSDGS